MTKQELFNQIIKKESFLCVGLDADLEKIPEHLLELDDPIFEFNKQIIDATKDYCVAYKPNLAFYESLGVKGWESLQKTMEYIPSDIFTIADAKRGDIGNTSKMYAKTFFEYFNFDSVTVAPYMGNDSVSPFLEFSNRWVILLAATSNVGGLDFQYKKIEGGKRVFEEVLEKSLEWGNEENLMYVVGATRAEMLSDVRAIVPDAFLLVPGVGAQGGSLEEVVKYGMNNTCGLLVNSSRGIIYAGSGNDFASAAGKKSKELQSQMAFQLNEFGLIKK
ncbi:orotidine-5'-phosphate decarboxylase [Flavobacteriales bacterium]|nr:orotidine-5'-phosphate decarboxylase [Flavobacteriales bacterium]